MDFKIDRPSTSTTSYIPSLDGWRSIAILSVISIHSLKILFVPEESWKGNLFYEILARGWIGVDIFFGISGFLVCTRLLDDEAALGKLHLKRFYVRRFFRILPPYLLYLAVIGSLGAAGLFSLDFSQWRWATLFLTNYLISSENIHWYLGHYWSLAIEEHFYLLLPGALLLVLSLRKRLFLIAGLSIAVMIWRFVEYRLGAVQSLLGYSNFFTRTDIRIDGLLYGALAAIFVRSEYFSEFRKRFLSKIWFRGAIFAAFILNEVFLPPNSIMFRAFLVPLLLLGTIYNPKGWSSRTLEAPPFRVIGRWSYSLYVWNNFFLISAAEQTAFGLPPIFSVGLQSFPMNYILLFGIAGASYYTIEKPLIRIGHRLTA